MIMLWIWQWKGSCYVYDVLLEYIITWDHLIIRLWVELKIKDNSPLASKFNLDIFLTWCKRGKSDALAAIKSQRHTLPNIC